MELFRSGLHSHRWNGDEHDLEYASCQLSS